MSLFAVCTLFLCLGNLGGSSLPLAGGASSAGHPNDKATTGTLEMALMNPRQKVDEGGLNDLPKMSALKSMDSGTNDTIKTVKRKVFNNTDETGQVTGNKTVVEKTTETDVKPNGNVSKTTETQVVIDEEGKESGEKSVKERETLTETTPNNGSLTQTVDVKKVTDEVVIKKEATVQPLTNATEEKPKDDKAATLLFPKVGADDQSKNKTETVFNASGKNDEPHKVERTEKTVEILPGNKTNEVLVTEKEEKLPSQETIKEIFVESKNFTEKGNGSLTAERTEVTKEILPGNKTNETLVTEKEERLPSQNSITMTFVEGRNATEKSDGPHKVERTEITKEILPGNKTNETLVTEKEERLPSQNSITMTFVEGRNATEKSDGPHKVERTEITKEILPGNKTNETLVIEKEERLPSQNSITMTFVEGRNATEKSDGPHKVERTEITKEILPGNKTNEVVVTEKEEKLPSQETIKETSVETKNVTENGDGPLITERTEITKEILPANETNEVVVTEKEEKLPSQETIKETSVETKNVTENGDGPLITERTEITKETLPGNKTNEVVVTEKEEKLPSQETIKEASVETKNVTENGDGPLITERTEITKEILPANETNEITVTEKEEKLPSRETAVTPPKVVKKLRRRKACRCDSFRTLAVVTEELVARIAAVVLKEMTTE
ncbi:uncharacterized protein LOC127009578 [Eriocheir sinensis]|uniref:uncharacterized protein LOC127009578 n=1 Tax=Eriocheir sinensis TaxID=95602 RepID=UPI0021C91D46|nr:uncharacterized protein LOC127009578 [Eriocheir sinensis]